MAANAIEHVSRKDAKRRFPQAFRGMHADDPIGSDPENVFTVQNGWLSVVLPNESGAEFLWDGYWREVM